MSAKAVSLRVAAERVGVSYQTARRRMADGTFPVPPLKRLGLRHRFSEYDIEAYLRTNATADAEKGAS